MNLIHLLEENCRALREKPAFIEKNRAVGYDAFYRRVSLVAAHLRKNDIGPGDNVLALMPLSVDLYATLCGVWATGACVIIFDPSAGRAHISACLEALPVKAFVGNRQSLLLRWVHPPLRRIPRQIAVEAALSGKGAAPCPIAPLPPEAPAIITFTSGSTGIPKAIVRSHGFLLEQHAALTAALPYDKSDVDLAVLAVFTLVNLMEGITTVLPRDSLRNIAKVDAGRLVAQIREHKVTRITASPKLMEKLAEYAMAHHLQLDTLRHINIGGGPVFPDVLEKVAQVADSTGLRVVYGSTEAEPIAELPYGDLTASDRETMAQGGGLPVGFPTQSIQIKIVHSESAKPLGPREFARQEVPAGQWGEIIVAGRHVVKGYLNPQQNAVAKVYANGATWHRTGDCGYLDGSGRLWLLGRLAQVIHIGEAPIFPFAIESAVRAKYGIVSAVTQVDNTVVLAVEDATPLPLLQEEYGERISVQLLKEIPMDRRHSSKIDYAALNAILRGVSK